MTETRQITLGMAAKKAGTERALEAVPAWAARARETALALLNLYPAITSENVTDLVGYPRTDRPVNGNNAVGAVFSKMATDGLIRRIGFVPARNPSAHGRLIARWERVQ